MAMMIAALRFYHPHLRQWLVLVTGRASLLSPAWRS
jgi:hypothetical protein